MAHLPCIGWVQVGGALALCECSTSSELCFFLAFTPFVLLPCLFDSAICANWCLSFVAWRMCELLGSYSQAFILFWIGHCLSKSFIFLLSPCFHFLWQWAFWLLIPPYHFIVLTIALPFFLILVTPWTCTLMFLSCQPISSSIFCSGLPRPTFHIFTSFGLCWPTSLLC